MHQQPQKSLKRYAWIAVAGALATMAIKFYAYWITQSVGLLSDALESLVNLLAAVIALRVLSIAAEPPDREHAYGHSKAEYFSSLFEGALIFSAAVGIGYGAFRRLLSPVPLGHLAEGLSISLVAAGINFFVARLLLRVGKRHNSITLEADGKHLMTDVWTSVGVLVAVGAVGLTGWIWLDPIIALIIGGNVGYTGIRLVERSVHGLMDASLPSHEIEKIRTVLERYRPRGVQHHALRTRQAGARNFVSVHLVIPGDWSVQQGHDLAEAVEREVRKAVPMTTVFTHVEPTEDPRSWEDQSLDAT